MLFFFTIFACKDLDTIKEIPTPQESQGPGTVSPLRKMTVSQYQNTLYDLFPSDNLSLVELTVDTMDGEIYQGNVSYPPEQKILGLPTMTKSI
jgi:hypothetical protein